MTETYLKDLVLNLYRRADFAGIAYSDGEEVERRIHAVVSSAQDRGTFSRELASAIVDWPTEYHLSRQRHCLVRPLGIMPGHKVLELGCGCGAITRYLGELGADVTAVEGSIARARIAAERCIDLPNVRIVADDLLRFSTDECFDWVLLIGVLEYAPMFSPENEPVQHYLRSVMKRLAPHGRLVVAIENKLGVKYFNGCGEDHLGVPFSGVQGLYGPNTPRTFGRSELQSQLTAAGFADVAFHYPFPDYKLPQVILSEKALVDPQFNPVDMLALIRARDYAGLPHRLFDEALVLREAAHNGLLGELSNSFLVVASRGGSDQGSADQTLATSYAVQRVPEFATQTRFVRRGDTIRVQKEALHEGLLRRRDLADGSQLENVIGTADYAPGELTTWKLLEARARHGELEQIVAALKPWFDHLLKMAKAMPGDERASDVASASLASLVLPGHALDLTPFNLMDTGQDLVPIDQEWRIDHDIAMGWVVSRAVLYALTSTVGFETSAIAVVDVIRTLSEHYELDVDEADIAVWLDLERMLQEAVTGRQMPEISLTQQTAKTAPFYLLAAKLNDAAETLNQKDAAIARLDEQIAVQKLTIDAQRRDMASLRNSRSWRITAPLRALQRRLPFRLLKLLKRGDKFLFWSHEGRQIKGTERAASFDDSFDYLPALLELIGSGKIVPPAEPIPDTTIVVPVYNGLDHLKRLLPSLAKNTDPRHQIVIIDDASPDNAVWPYLDAWSRARPNVKLVRSTKNQGFVRTVNAGAAMATSHFVIVNTDTEVPPGWLERMIQPIVADPTIASVTPFSNSATIFSFPNFAADNARFGELDTECIDAGFQALSGPSAIPLEAPTGVGFCMAINADVWGAIGGFDQDAFPKGYGEENDWCQRAYAAGFRSVLAPNLFVRDYKFGKVAGSMSASELLTSAKGLLSNLDPAGAEPSPRVAVSPHEAGSGSRDEDTIR